MAIDDYKTRLSDCRLKYKLSHVDVYESPEGHHFTALLDDVASIPPEIDYSQLTGERRSYTATQLESSKTRFAHQLAIVKDYVHLPSARILDVGCGGGMFLSLCKEAGASVQGIELCDYLAAYASEKVPVSKCPIESPHWDGEQFDAVTLWDVIEHANYPERFLLDAIRVLKPRGWLFIDTPAKDGGYYRIGQFTHWLTRGKFPTLLGIQYSNETFGHKQILSTSELRSLCEEAGLKVWACRKFHELSFPVEFYLQRLMPNGLAKFLAAPIAVALPLFPIRNKMLVVAQKR